MVVVVLTLSEMTVVESVNLNVCVTVFVAVLVVVPL